MQFGLGRRHTEGELGVWAAIHPLWVQGCPLGITLGSADEQVVLGTAGLCQASRIFLVLLIIYKVFFELGGRTQRTWDGMLRDVGSGSMVWGTGFDLP